MKKWFFIFSLLFFSAFLSSNVISAACVIDSLFADGTNCDHHVSYDLLGGERDGSCVWVSSGLDGNEQWRECTSNPVFRPIYNGRYYFQNGPNNYGFELDFDPNNFNIFEEKGGCTVCAPCWDTSSLQCGSDCLSAKFDVSEGKCIFCDGVKEKVTNGLCASNINVWCNGGTYYIETNDDADCRDESTGNNAYCFGTGDGQCEYACGADVYCDEKNFGQACGPLNTGSCLPDCTCKFPGTTTTSTSTTSTSTTTTVTVGPGCGSCSILVGSVKACDRNSITFSPCSGCCGGMEIINCNNAPALNAGEYFAYRWYWRTRDDAATCYDSYFYFWIENTGTGAWTYEYTDGPVGYCDCDNEWQYYERRAPYTAGTYLYRIIGVATTYAQTGSNSFASCHDCACVTAKDPNAKCTSSDSNILTILTSATTTTTIPPTTTTTIGPTTTTIPPTTTTILTCNGNTQGTCPAPCIWCGCGGSGNLYSASDPCVLPTSSCSYTICSASCNAKMCNRCSGTLINTWRADTCVASSTNCGYHCEQGQCGAACDDNSDCPQYNCSTVSCQNCNCVYTPRAACIDNCSISDQICDGVNRDCVNFDSSQTACECKVPGNQGQCSDGETGCWDSSATGSNTKCCGDDATSDDWCHMGGGSCVDAKWHVDHCSDNVSNCDEKSFNLSSGLCINEVDCGFGGCASPFDDESECGVCCVGCECIDLKLSSSYISTKTMVKNIINITLSNLDVTNGHTVEVYVTDTSLGNLTSCFGKKCEQWDFSFINGSGEYHGMQGINVNVDAAETGKVLAYFTFTPSGPTPSDVYDIKIGVRNPGQTGEC